MVRAALVVALFVPAVVAAAEDEKPIKSDVVVKSGEKAAKAKAGDSVEFQVQFPVVPPFPKGYSVKVDGKKVRHEERNTAVRGPGGQLVVGSQIRSLFIKADGKGKQKVEVEYMKGNTKETWEIELTVAD